MTDEIPWGELGEQWWRETGAQVHATEKQIAFAACRHANINRTLAAILSGYTDDKERARKKGSEANQTTAVQTMITLARAEGAGVKGPEGIVTATELMQKLSDLMRGKDPNLSLRAGTELAKLIEPQAGEGPLFGHEDGFDDWRLVREYLRLPNGAPAIALLWTGQDRALASLPLLHDVAAAVEREAPAVWEQLRRQQNAVGRAMLDRHLANPGWQRDARVKLWSEVGVDIDAPAEPAGASNPQAAVAGFNGHGAHDPASRADARA